MVVLGPLGDDPGPFAALTDDDRAWLARMADVLPPGMPVAGTDAWWLHWLDPALLEDSVR